MNRRGLVSGLGALFLCTPAIVRISSLMPLSIQPRGISFDPVPMNMLVPMFYTEVDTLFDPEYLNQLRVVASIVENHVELPDVQSI